MLGVTIPFTIILQAGPVVFVQVTVIALTTFLTIYWVGTRWLKLDQRVAATLAAGGLICRVVCFHRRRRIGESRETIPKFVLGLSGSYALYSLIVRPGY